MNTVQLSVYTTTMLYAPNSVLSRTAYLLNTLGSAAFAFITPASGIIDGNSVLEGYGVVILSPTFEGGDVSFYLDGSGNLVVDGPDETKYAIDANGNLCYTP